MCVSNVFCSKTRVNLSILAASLNTNPNNKLSRIVYQHIFNSVEITGKMYKRILFFYKTAPNAIKEIRKMKRFHFFITPRGFPRLKAVSVRIQFSSLGISRVTTKTQFLLNDSICYDEPAFSSLQVASIHSVCGVFKNRDS